MLPFDPAWEWPVVSVTRPNGGSTCKMLDLKRLHEFRLQFAFFGANPHLKQLDGNMKTVKQKTRRHFDEQMAEVICEAVDLHLDEDEEDFSLLETTPLVFWARVQERLQGYGTNSFVLHGLIKPQTLVEFFKLMLDSFKGYAGPSHLSRYTRSTCCMHTVAYILGESESPVYHGPDPHVVYGEREKRVVTADGVDLDMLGRGKDEAGDTHMMEEDAGIKVFKSEEFVPAGWDDEDHDGDEEPSNATNADHYYGDEEGDDRYYMSDPEDDHNDNLMDMESQHMQADAHQEGYAVPASEDHSQGTGQFDLSKLSEALPS
jgi:hypothetical protein